MVVHLVNYDRDENYTQYKEDGTRSVTDRENPIPLHNIEWKLRVPEGACVSAVWLVSPDFDRKVDLPFNQEGERVVFTVPQISIYDVIIVEL